jgi:hypothetical protein
LLSFVKATAFHVMFNSWLKGFGILNQALSHHGYGCSCCKLQDKVLEEPVRSSSLPINRDWNESWNVGTERNPRSVKMPAMTQQDWFKDAIE